MKTIQIQIDSGKTGPAPQYAADYNVVLPVALWRGEPANIAVALFSDSDTVADVSNVSEITLEISTDAAHTTPDFTQTIDALDTGWDETITKADWIAGTAQHALFEVNKGDVAPDMESSEIKQMYLRITMIDNAEWVVLCNGPISVHEAGDWPV